jgi:hypothetical protein
MTCPTYALFWNERMLMALLVYDKGTEDETFQRRGMINDSWKYIRLWINN